MLKMAVVAPMPTASVAIAGKVNVGRLVRRRTAIVS
jgi:hypothetical protein